MDVPRWILSTLLVATVWFGVLGVVRLLASRQMGARSEARAQGQLALMSLFLAGLSAVGLIVLLLSTVRA